MGLCRRLPCRAVAQIREAERSAHGTPPSSDQLLDGLAACWCQPSVGRAEVWMEPSVDDQERSEQPHLHGDGGRPAGLQGCEVGRWVLPSLADLVQSRGPGHLSLWDGRMGWSLDPAGSARF